MRQMGILLQTALVELAVLQEDFIRHLPFLRLIAFYELYALIDPNSHQLLQGGGFRKLVATYPYWPTAFLHFAELK